MKITFTNVMTRTDYGRMKQVYNSLLVVVTARVIVILGYSYAHLSKTCERNISLMPWGSFFQKLIKFWRSKVKDKVTMSSQKMVWIYNYNILGTLQENRFTFSPFALKNELIRFWWLMVKGQGPNKTHFWPHECDDLKNALRVFFSSYFSFIWTGWTD